MKIDIFNVTGQKVTTLLNEYRNAGTHQVSWDASGSASGVYFYRLSADSFVESKKMLLLK
ncbi:MAG: T9SS type A sorting domain-containing protein [bacterium]|nr:T9SS type A sorting domain-containing protein [bacterium]